MPKLYANIPSGYACTMVSDGVTSGTYVQMTPGSKNTPSTFSASATTVIGAFNGSRDYEISYSGNAPSLSIAETGVFTAADEAGLFSASLESNMAEIANDATGTAIATAVNGILAILIANGMMEAPEE